MSSQKADLLQKCLLELSSAVEELPPEDIQDILDYIQSRHLDEAQRNSSGQPGTAMEGMASGSLAATPRPGVKGDTQPPSTPGSIPHAEGQ